MAWPTTDEPRNKFVTVRFTEKESVDIDAFAGGDRSKFVRNCVNRVIAAEKKRAKRLAAKAPNAPGGALTDPHDRRDS